MPSPGKPSDEQSLLAHPLGLITRLVVRAPRWVCGLGLGLAVAAILLTVTRLEFRTSRLDLLNPESAYNQRWIKYLDDFAGHDDTVIMVMGPSQAEVLPVIERVAEELGRHDQFFQDVLYKVDLERLSAKQLHFLTPDQLGQLQGFLYQVNPVLEGDWSSLSLGSQLDGLMRAANATDPQVRHGARQALHRHADNLRQLLAGQRGYQSPWPDMPFGNVNEDPFKTQYLLADEGRIGIMLLRLVISDDSFDRGSATIDRLRGLLAEINAEYPDVQLGLTGLPVMENDEMRASEDATIKSGVVSLVGVALLFMVGFGGLRHPLLCVFALVVALCWTFGYVTLAVGHLNILSMSFGMILIGLGIDFGIHYVARYLHTRPNVGSTAEALIASAKGVGPGVATGAVTTSLAFFAAALTDFTGIAELGVIAGGGILLCLASAMFLLPALVQLADGRRAELPKIRMLSVQRWLAFTHYLPRTTLFAALTITLVCCLGLGHVWYDHNLLNLQPLGLESVRLEHKLLDETDQSVWFAISIADTPEEVLARKARFEKLPSVERTEEIASLLPGSEEMKAPIIRQIAARLGGLPTAPPQIPVDPPTEVARRLHEIPLSVGLAPPGQTEDPKWDQLATLLRQDHAHAYRALTIYQQQVAYDLLMRLQGLRDASNPLGPDLEDLPPSLVKRFVGASGKHLIKVYSKRDIWNMDDLTQFVTETRSVDPRITGQPVQTFHASRQMQASYVHAALYALIAVLMVLVLDFRSVGYSLLAICPVGLGLLQMFGLLGWLNIPLNPANMIVLPLILGIGLDYGVHVLHDYREQSGRFRLNRSTATAVVLTALTTMIGFGSMMIADHRGLESLGRVLTIGVFCCLFNALVALPALLAWVSRHAVDPPPTPPDEVSQENEPPSEIEPAPPEPATGAATSSAPLLVRH